MLSWIHELSIEMCVRYVISSLIRFIKQGSMIWSPVTWIWWRILNPEPPVTQSILDTNTICQVDVRRLMTHIERIRGVFDVANSQRYRAGFAPMLFQWSHAHIARFFIAKNRAIKRGLERKNRAMCVMALINSPEYVTEHWMDVFINAKFWPCIFCVKLIGIFVCGLINS